MRNFKMLTVLFAAFMLTFAACKKDDSTPGIQPEITTLEISADNAEITVNLNEAVYSKNDKTGNLDASCFSVGVSDLGITATYSVTHVAGESVATINLTFSNRVKAGVTLQVTALKNKVYNADGGALEADFSKTTTTVESGIIGKWSAYDISAILQSLSFDDSLYANFKADQSYEVTAFYLGTPLAFKGTYTQTKSASNDIWDIVLTQTLPSAVTSQGIFKSFTASPDSMWYEVAQVDPAIAGVTPPTAAVGFGSTSGGALGTMNIQKYHWIGQIE
jgi:hypothetical protein